MRHVTISEHGRYLGLEGARLKISGSRGAPVDVPLSRIKTISIQKQGVSMSAALVQACAARGIKMFILDPRGRNVASVFGVGHHAISRVRRAQFGFCESSGAVDVCRQIIAAKLHNQRAVLLYFGKYLNKKGDIAYRTLSEGARSVLSYANSVEQVAVPAQSNWRDKLLGYEGRAARVYWDALREAHLLPLPSGGRTGRGANDIVNQSLNYGYGVLSTMVWHCTLNAGLEPYVGVLHQEKAGKPSLVLDLMEEFRAWAVDRSVIKLRHEFGESSELSRKFRQRIAREVIGTFGKRYPYRNRRITLESILQRQTYRLAGVFSDGRSYRGYHFKW